ncbi:MAG: GMC family oxidoreductase N-terminal domain-containing protein [Rhizobiales bacterium]|nr:GMC family oxidoreductase N-terminal domain-containing protein [Hyphomicrobiales bacterium]MBI3671873.1 GMC family oxidoreductase N-terminal domain-containing protein [Hyphomicrobiales bacterium]
MEFDYIVVGAGSAGCIVANRLALEGKASVLLLEAGPSDRDFLFTLPLGYGATFYDPRYNWMYWSEPVAGLGGRSAYVPRGKVLGGSSSINAMVYMRGAPEDFADWVTAGNPGWGWNDVVPAYEAIEAQLNIGSTESVAHPLCRRYLDAGLALGLPLNHQPNNGLQMGVGYHPVTTHDGRRRSASAVFLRPALASRRVRVETGALASRILFEGRKAVGVAYVKGGEMRKATTRREVIVSAGAINSPQLLQLSGVGPVGLLTRLGVPVVAANEAVGRNLQDHACYDHYYKARVPTTNQELGPLPRRALAVARYMLFRTGTLSGSLNHAGGFICSNESRTRPNLQLYFCASSYDRAPPKTRQMTAPDPFPGLSISVSSCRPTSIGWVEAKTPSVEDAPAIQPNLLATDHDMQEMLEGAKFLRKLTATPPLSTAIAEEFKPGLQVATDAELIADIRARTATIFHPCGTLRMGEGGAVDSELRVRGVEALRVIDASVFPNIIAGNINGPAMMVGWKGTGLLLR